MQNLSIHEYKLFAKMLPLKQNSESFGFKNRKKKLKFDYRIKIHLCSEPPT